MAHLRSSSGPGPPSNSDDHRGGVSAANTTSRPRHSDWGPARQCRRRRHLLRSRRTRPAPGPDELPCAPPGDGCLRPGTARRLSLISGDDLLSFISFIFSFARLNARHWLCCVSRCWNATVAQMLGESLSLVRGGDSRCPEGRTGDHRDPEPAEFDDSGGDVPSNDIGSPCPSPNGVDGRRYGLPRLGPGGRRCLRPGRVPMVSASAPCSIGHEVSQQQPSTPLDRSSCI